MAKSFPSISDKIKLLIICEGYEEEDYLHALVSLGVWNPKLKITIHNAKSIDNISALYQYYYQTNTYKGIIIFCDTEKAPYQPFLTLKKKINSFHNKKKYADQIVYFANPCTMQIILSHFDKVSLISNSKSNNNALIQRLTGVKNYLASKNQRSAIIRKINPSNYNVMKRNISFLSSDYNMVPSSNILQLFENLESSDLKWIK